MSICPKGKVSKGKRNQRRAQSWQIPTANLSVCPKCKELMKAHRACKACGTYNKRVVINAEA